MSEIRSKRNVDFIVFVVDAYNGTALYTNMLVNSFNTVACIGLNIIFTVIQSYILFLLGLQFLPYIRFHEFFNFQFYLVSSLHI